MTDKNLNPPAHVPRELIVDFDTFNPPDGVNDYHRAISHSHDFPDIFWTPYRGGYWVATRGEDLTVLLKDYENFGSYPKTIPKEEATPIPLYPFEADPKNIWSVDDDDQGHDNMDHGAMPGMKMD